LHIRFFLLPPAPCLLPDLNKQFKLRTAYIADNPLPVRTIATMIDFYQGEEF
jgi:hypothetical protein